MSKLKILDRVATRLLHGPDKPGVRASDEGGFGTSPREWDRELQASRRRLQIITIRHPAEAEEQRVLCEPHAREAPRGKNETITDAPGLDHECAACATGEPLAPQGRTSGGLRARLHRWWRR